MTNGGGVVHRGDKPQEKKGAADPRQQGTKEGTKASTTESKKR